jgi:hypothetical protein
MQRSGSSNPPQAYNARRSGYHQPINPFAYPSHYAQADAQFNAPSGSQQAGASVSGHGSVNPSRIGPSNVSGLLEMQHQGSWDQPGSIRRSRGGMLVHRLKEERLDPYDGPTLDLYPRFETTEQVGS